MIDLRTGSRAGRPRRALLDDGVDAAVRAIVADGRARGDQALIELTRRFDGADLSAAGLEAGPEELAAAGEAVEPDVRAAIDGMIERLRRLHERQLPNEWSEDRDGVRFGEIVRPVGRAGCYVPGGRAAYPSTVAMTVVPAAVAGVGEIVVTTPPREDGSLPPEVLHTADRAGADRIIKVGGAQAIATLAYGTESVPAVDTIVGPGNVYVTAAKRAVAGDVGIDGLAGPTELVIVADRTAEPSLIEADLAAQAEHDPLAAATVVTTDADLISSLPEALPQTRFVVAADLEQAAEAVNDLAPEHLELLLAKPREFLPLVRNAGAIFVGPWSAVPFGDYGVGSNHVLPTMGTARFASGLRVTNFVKVSAVVEIAADAAARLGGDVASIARAERLVAHARAVEVRRGYRGGAR
ncbi:MAG: histidinol dehydrogenase [Actinomycetota bacterium]